MDKDVIISYIPHFKEALFLTLKIGWLGILLSLFFSLLFILEQQEFLVGTCQLNFLQSSYLVFGELQKWATWFEVP